MVLPWYPSEGLPNRPARAYARLRVRNIEHVLQVPPQGRTVFRVRQGERDEGLEVRVEISDVVSALAGAEPHAERPATVPDHRPDGVGQLDLAPFAAPGARQRREDPGRQHVARGNRQAARRLARPRFLHQIEDLEDLAVRFRLGDAVLADLLRLHFFERDHGGGLLLEITLRHPLHDVAFRMHADDRVAERHDERLVPDERLGARNRVAETEQPPLAGVEVLDARALVFERRQQVFLAAFAQGLNQLAVQIEVVLDRRFARTGHEQDALHPDAREFLDDVLHDRFAAHRQNFLLLRLGGRQHPRAEARDRHDADIDVHTFTWYERQADYRRSVRLRRCQVLLFGSTLLTGG